MSRILRYILCICLCVVSYAFIKIKITGNNVISNQAIFDAVYFPLDDEPAHWNQAVKDLYHTDWFDKITIEIEGNQAMVNVKEYPLLLGYKINGNFEQLTSDKLIEMLESAGIKRGNLLPLHKLEQWRLSMIREFQNMGYNDISLTTNLIKENRGVVLDINIDTGLITYIKKIIIKNSSFSNKILEDVLPMKKHNFWRYIDQANKFSGELVYNTKETLKAFYLRKGYFDVKIDVKASEVAKGKNKKFVDLYINVNEGPRYKISKVDYFGACNNVTSIFKNIDGSYYNADELSNKISTSNLIKDDLQVRMQPRLTKDGVNLLVFCSQPKAYFLRNVVVIGDGTDDLLLRKLLDFDEGDYWRSSWLQSSKRRLLSQPYVADASITLEPALENPDQADVVVKVEESKKNSTASFRLSYEQGGSGISFGGGFSNKNFLGTGNFLSIESQYSSSAWFVNLQLQQPLLLRAPSATMGFAFENVNQDQLNMGPYTKDVASAYYGYRWLFNDNLLFNSQANLRSYHMHYSSQDTNSWLYQEFKKYGYDPIEFSWSNTFAYDTRDRADMTTSGILARFTANTVLPVFPGMMSYYQIVPSVTHYYKLADLFSQSLVLRSNLQFGYGHKLNGDEDSGLPFYNRFYAGGVGTVRGYYAMSLGPHYELNGRRMATGGNWLLVGNIDLLLPSPSPDFVQPSLFLDGGSVFLDSIHVDDLRYSTGLSAAVNTPFAQLTLTLSYPINPGDCPHRTFTIEFGRQF